MIRKSILSFIFLGITLFLTAQQQPYGHEWVSFSNNTPTLKIKVVQNGLYRVSYAMLDSAYQKAGYNLSQVDPRDMALINKGEQVPVFISGESDGQWNPGDYLEFFGEKNDAWFDQFLYSNKKHHPNPYFSNFSDTAVYFLVIRPNPAFVKKRLETVNNNLSNPGPKRQFFTNTQIFSYHAEWNGGHASNQGGTFLYSPEYTNGEGFVDGNFNKASITKNLLLDGIFRGLSGSKAKIMVNLVSYYDQTHRIRLSMNGNMLLDTSYYGQGVRPLETEIGLGKLTAKATNALTLQALGTGSSDRNAVAYIRVSYPCDFDFNQKTFYRFNLEGPKNKTVYFEVNNFDALSSTPILYDLGNNQRMIGNVSGNAIRFNLPFPNADTARLVLSSEAKILAPAGISEAHFHELSRVEEQGNYLLIYHPSLRDDGSGNDVIQAYSDYRGSAKGGDFQVVSIPITTIYDQFGYGIDRHPQAIRNFVRYMLDSFKVLPEYILLAGKGVEYENTRLSQHANNRKIDLIPPFGSPGGDMLYTVNKNNQPMIAIGRLSVRNGSQMLNYFEKLKALEENQQRFSGYTIEEMNWTKNVLHFGGGSDNSQQNLFKSFLASYQRKIENPYFGGRVYSFFKSNSDPIQYVQSRFLDSVISSGVSLITFFGHSSTNSFDISLDKPENYDNFGKTPVIVSNGCFSGQIFSSGYGVSEDFVLQNEGGAIGFLASTSYGEQFSLNQYSDKLYQNLSKYRYNEGFGKAILHTVRYVLDTTNPNIFSYYLAFQNTFHGDPAVKINTHAKPDYAVEPQFIAFEPQNVSVDLDSFTVAVHIHNVGKAVRDSYLVEVRRTFADGSFALQSKRVAACYSDDTVRLRFYTDPVKGINRNEFEVIVDAGNAIEELREDNNSAKVAINISSIDAFPLYPYPYGIAHGDIILKANTADFSLDSRNYLVEIDTTALFDSPLMRNTTISSSGGIFEWINPPVPFMNETVYYWRVKPETNGNDSATWKMSSFLYSDQDISGWNQSHYYQFLDDQLENVQFDGRQLNYIDDVKELRLTNGYSVGWSDVTAYYINGTRINRYGCAGDNSITFGVIDPASGLPWKPADYNFGQASCYWTTQKGAFHFPASNIAQRQRILEFIDSIPDGYYFFAMSFKTKKETYATWRADSAVLGSSILIKLAEQGASRALFHLDTLKYHPSFIFFTKKGDPSTASTLITKNQYQLLDTTVVIKGKWNQGYINSPPIGPVTAYRNLEWESKDNPDPVNVDETQMTFIGMDATLQNEDKLFTTEKHDSVLTTVDAGLYPFARLRYYMLDDSFRTALGLKKWRVLYDPPGDLAINPRLHFYLSNDTVEQGEEVAFSVAVENISEYDMDSTLIAIWHINSKNQRSLLHKKRYKAMPAGDTLILSLKHQTLDDEGRNTLIVEVNPDHDQAEQYSFNNQMNIAYTVIRDKRNPLLDVTFDGRHIMDNDIVSAKPQINIVLLDDNRFLPLNDTALINVFLVAPGSGRKRLAFTRSDLQFIPANEDPEGKNQAEIIYTPEFERDGRYELIVRASDKTGNRAGDLDYQIGFRVFTENSISNVFNYPNPFSSSTRFVFTITGSEVPQDLKIQIMTVTGRVVREIDKDELGPLVVGSNITQFAWDGSDQYGDPLANGLYLYRIITRDAEGKSLKNFELPSNADRFFKNGIGKIYLAR